MNRILSQVEICQMKRESNLLSPKVICIFVMFWREVLSCKAFNKRYPISMLFVPKALCQYQFLLRILASQEIAHYHFTFLMIGCSTWYSETMHIWLIIINPKWYIFSNTYLKENAKYSFSWILHKIHIPHICSCCKILFVFRKYPLYLQLPQNSFLL